MKNLRPQRLTAFQQLMRGWSELAPYNFIHALRLDVPVDVERWQHAAESALRILGIGGTRVSIETPVTEIEAHLDAELNRAFLPDEIPLRFFAIAIKDGGHWFGVAIDHWLADDYSCRALLHEIYALFAAQAPESRPALEWASNFPDRNGWLTRWTAFFKESARLRRARRTLLRKPLDFSTRAFRTELPEPSLAAIRSLARHDGATVHDVFLAATAQAFGAARPWPPGDRRDAVAVASAMDLRRFQPDGAKGGFGLLLSQYTIVEQRPEEREMSQLIRDIATQTRRLKSFPGTELHTPTLTISRLSPSRHSKATLFNRGAPVVAGLSNVDLSGSWIERSPILEYRRVGPAGPVVPMVLMITTLRGRIFLDTTFRLTAFTRSEAETVIADFAKRLPGD